MMQQKTDSQVAVAYEAIRDQVISFTLSPGQTLSDHKLAKQLDMSRASVREAILMLQMDGLVRLNADGKMCVAPIGIDDIVDILHVRGALESEALRLIADAGWLTGEQEDVLRALHASVIACTESGDATEQYRYDDLFHSTLVEFSGSMRICDLLGRLRLQMQRARFLNIANPARQRATALEHERLLQALMRHDLDASICLLREHFQNSADTFRQVLESQQMRALSSMLSSFYQHDGG